MSDVFGQIIHFIKEHWVFDEARYPTIPQGKDERFIFSVRHILLHWMKDVGKLSAIMEKIDHESGPNITEMEISLKTILVSVLYTALKLAEILEIGDQEIFELIKSNYGDSQRKV